ncbi:MAG TPA: ribokinase [Micromonosporaceae bacterium]|nr:ribokinase [Micromonosporaceae bacterium]HCU49379.1 ribokinase [Micromonosporaceae bacterium]
MSRVVVVGSVNMDLVVTAPTLPRPGETVLGETFTTVPGGKGANQAIAAARAGAQCAFIGAVGQDGFGEALRANLTESGVDISRLRVVPGTSGVALIAVDIKAENLIVVAPGANATLTRLEIQDRVAIEAADVLLCQLEIPLATVAQAAAAARTAGTTVILNAAPARALPPELLAAVDLLVVNQTEAVTIAGGQAGLDSLLEKVSRVVMTLGAAGAVYADREGTRLEVPAPRVEAVDTTAAGDAFAGALAVAWAQGRPLDEALRWACAAGAVCATRRGAVLPRAHEIDQLYRASL